MIATGRITLNVHAMGGHHQRVHFLAGQFREIFAHYTKRQMLERVPGPTLCRVEKRLNHDKGRIKYHAQPLISTTIGALG